LTRFITQPTWMIRANTCASGRNSNVLAPVVSNRPSRIFTAGPSSSWKFEWLILQPFGRPVVPEV
jgi:hypothetical protein